MKFSVLMSVYAKENPEYLEEALNSVLVSQTILPNEVVLVEDGPLTRELYDVIGKFKKTHQNLRVCSLESNVGLGLALQFGLSQCQYDWVARMDTDDIAVADRFEKQIRFLSENSHIDLVGSNIKEFVINKDDIIFEKKLPEKHVDILKMSKKRNPIAHMTVFFKKSSVEKVGGYMHLPFVEDYYLWVRLMANGYSLANMADPLVYVRVGNGMFDRRGNLSQIKSWKKLNQFMYENKMINIFERMRNQCYINLFVRIPPELKKYIYKKLLRN